MAPRNLTWNGPLLATRGRSLAFSGMFSDPSVLDSQQATVDWGDRSVTAANLMKTGGSWQVTAKHVYGSGGADNPGRRWRNCDAGNDGDGRGRAGEWRHAGARGLGTARQHQVVSEG